MISVRPDPSRPRGGYAELSLQADDLSADSTQVAVFDNYSERYLGQSGWQATQVMFGPYAVVRDGSMARLVIGPEIVNQIAEFANVKLIVGAVRQDIIWPDDVVPAPGAAKIGGIMAAAPSVAAPQSTLKANAPESEAGSGSEPPGPVAPVPPVETAGEKKRPPYAVALLVLLVLLAGISYWFLFQQDEMVASAPASDDAGPCSARTLKGIAGFDAQLAALRACGGKAETDVALGLVEQAAAAGDPQALLLFGMVYDGEAAFGVVEEDVGLTFGDVPATAAEYYSRAVAAGSVEASQRLSSLCVRMQTMTDTLTQGAVADYCEE
ncbi:MAG: hypothetical protein PVI41_07680 [Roseobacter sp.]